MKYIIYGANRVAEDFIYIFDNLNILYIIDDIEDIDNFCKHRVETMQYALSDNAYDQIIICDFDKSMKEEVLQKNGLIYGKDYLYEEDFFTQLDEVFIPQDRKIAIWGTGNMSKFLLEHNLPWKIDIFIDSYRKQELLNNIAVYLPNNISDWKEYYIIIAIAKNEEIQEYLSGHGLIKNIDFIDYKDFLELPSIMLRQTIFDKSCYDLKCKTVLNHLEFLANEIAINCCPSLVSQGIGNVLDKNGIYFISIYEGEILMF